MSSSETLMEEYEKMLSLSFMTCRKVTGSTTVDYSLRRALDAAASLLHCECSSGFD